MADLFNQQTAAKAPADYSAKDIEVLEGLEPVRRRPGMYIGGTDEKALHHLVAELLDNAMDEAVAGHASWIEIELLKDGSLAVRDNGRGIPVDPHPKFPDRSALEVILTTLHSGGKFGGDSYITSGGLHGVGLSVVNALSDRLTVEVARDRNLWQQHYERGAPVSPLNLVGPVHNRRGTAIICHPDPQIFGKEAGFRPAQLYRMARAKAYLYAGVEVRWNCDLSLLGEDDVIPAREVFKFPAGLQDFLDAQLSGRARVGGQTFAGTHGQGDGRVEWALAWAEDGAGFCDSFCNTIPTSGGGSHELGLRAALLRALREYGERVGNRRAAGITAEDVMAGAGVVLSLFMREPLFQGQTKERLASPEASRIVDSAIKDHFDHWLAGDPAAAGALLDHVVETAEERLRKKQDRETARKGVGKRLRLPGKLTDCSNGRSGGSELFLVEGDSAGGSAKQGRNRETQAVLPLRGKILNVASASADKLRANQEVRDLIEALGCGSRATYDEDRLRYERIIIMTDADVDGAHIAALLMTFFYQEMPGLITGGHLFLACPPLYRLTAAQNVVYARDDAHKDELLATVFAGKKVEISRFKGLGEMPPAQLKETTMAVKSRVLLRVMLAERQSEEGRDTAKLVEQLMGRQAEPRFRFIQERARFARDLDI